MNDHNQQNIEFVRNLSQRPQDLKQWLLYVHESGDADEIAYAFLILNMVCSQIEIELLDFHDAESEHDVALAAAYLKRFRLQ